MDAARWERIQLLFHDAANRPASEQHTFLRAQCADDPALVDEVLSLLAEDARGDSILDSDVAVVASVVLGTPSPPTLPSDTFGPYRLTRTLGEGGMGVVYLAERSDLGSVAAIKILRDAWLSPLRRERFASEQRTLAQLNHPAIARLFDAGALPDGTPWFVMEYVDGLSLTRYCESHSTYIPDRLRLFRSVCEAVQHAHRHAVIHRDIKPSNILVTAEGSVKLLDFGIAKQVESLDLTAEHTRTGLRMMTPAYAAPEQVRGDRVGVHTDVYSLGVTLYELLAGRLPFDFTDRSPAEIETVILEHDPVRPSAVARQVAQHHDGAQLYPSVNRAAWADLDVLCLTAMHKDAQRRYPTVEALVRDIDHYLKDEPLEARPDSARYRMGKFTRRHWRSVSITAALLLFVVALVAFYTSRLASARNEAVREAARTQRIQRFTLGLFDGGQDNVAPSDSLRVVTLVDRGLQTARSLDAEPAAQAELYETLGGIYLKLGKLQRADTLLRAALAGRRALNGGDNTDVARSLVALGQLREAQASYDDAEKLIRDGLAMILRQSPGDPSTVAAATLALGGVLMDRGEYAQAIPTLSEALRLQKAAGAPEEDISSSITALASTHFYLGHYATADSLNHIALEIDRRLYGDRHTLVAADLINIGAVQFQRGHYDEAERYYRQALSIDEGWYGEDNPVVASNLTMLGRAMSYQGRFDEADDVLRRAIAIQERVYGPVHPAVASALNDLATIALQQGRLDTAEADYRRMRDIYRKVYGDKHYLVGVAVANLGSVYLERKDYAHAEQLFREAVRRYSDAQGPDHMNTGIARIKLGRSLLRQGKYAEAARESLAGYEIAGRQTSPSVSWLHAARKDLVAEYEALGQPDRAAHFRADSAAAKPEPAAVKLR